MRTRLPVVLLAILVALLFVNLGKALTHAGSGDAPTATVYTSPAEERRVTTPDGERMIDRRFRVSAGDLLDIGVAHADVEIETGADGEAHVEVILEADDMARAKEYFDAMRFTVEQRGNTIEVTSDPRGHRNRSFDRSGRPRILVRAFIPERFDADVEIAHGDLYLDALEGETEVQIAHGDVRTNALRGESIEFQIAHGDLTAEALQGASVAIQIAHGDVEIATVATENLEAELAHGDITIQAFEGHADVANAHGDIDIRFTKADGFRMHNSHGDIRLTAPAGTPGTLAFDASRVNVASAYPFEGTIKKNRAEGRINGGGPLMEARTSHGDITLDVR